MYKIDLVITALYFLVSTQAVSAGINCVKLDITVITSQSIAIRDSLSLDCYQKWAVDPAVQ